MTKEGCQSTLEGLGRDLLIRLTYYLDPYSMAQLGRTSSQFGLSRTGGRQRSLVNEAAHRRLSAANETERSRLLRSGVEESDVGLYRELALLRRPCWFVPHSTALHKKTNRGAGGGTARSVRGGCA